MKECRFCWALVEAIAAIGAFKGGGGRDAAALAAVFGVGG